MIVRFLPGRWAEHLTMWEAQAEPVRLGDHIGRGTAEHDLIEPLRRDHRAGAAVLCCRAGAAV